MIVKSLNAIDYFIVAIYLLSMIAIGFLLSRSNKNDSDYFKGGNKIPWVMAGISLFIGQLSAYMFVAASGQAYTNGIASIVLFTIGAPVSFVIAFIMAYKWRRTRIGSPIEYVGLRYGKATQKFYTLVQIPIFLLFLGNFLYILCIFLTSALRLPQSYEILGFEIGSIQLCIIVTGIIITAYTSSGGLWAVVVTDTIQFLIVMLVSIFILILSVKLFSADAGISRSLSDYIANPPTQDYLKIIKPGQPLYFTLAWLLLTIITYPTEYGTIQRCFSVPTERDACKLNILAGFCFLIVPSLWLLPVIVLRKHLPDMTELWQQLNNPSEGAYVTIALSLLPNGLIGLTLSAILAATMSTMSTVYNFLSSIVTENVYKPLFAQNISPKQAMQAGKIITLVLGFFSIIVAIILSKGKSAFETTFTITGYVQTAIAFPLLVGLFVKNVYKSTAIVSSGLCFLTTFSVGFVMPKVLVSLGYERLSSHQIFSLMIVCGALVSGLVFLISFLLFKRNPKNNVQAEQLFERLSKPVCEDDENDVYIPNLKMYNYVAWSVIFYAAVLFLVHITNLTDDPQSANLIMAVMFLAVGVVVKWLISPKYSPFKIVRIQQSGK